MMLTLDRQVRGGKSFVNLGGILRFTQQNEVVQALDLIPASYDRIREFIHHEIIWHEGRANFTMENPADFFIGDISQTEQVQGRFASESTFILEPGRKVVLSSDSGFHKLRISLENES